MNFAFLNPMSKHFLQGEIDASTIRSIEAQSNSYGHDEDQADWMSIVGNRGTNVATADMEQSNILFDAVFATKQQRISFYRSMALYPLVKKAVTIMTDEAICENSKGEIAKFDLKTEFRSNFKVSEYKQLKKEFDFVMNCVIKKDELWYLFYRWIVDGEQFWELCPSIDGKSLAGIKVLPAYCSLVIYHEGVAEGYIEDPRMISITSEEGIKRFTLNQIAYSSYGFWGANRNDVRGHLEPAIRPLNQLRAIEDALVVYRITRAPEKRIFNIYTGRMPRKDAIHAVNDAKAKYRKVLSIDPVTGSINSSKNVQAFTEDFWFSKGEEGQSTVENFKGSTEFNGQLDDVKMFQQQVLDALQIPNTRGQESEGIGNFAMAPEQQLSEISFQKMCRRLAKRFANDMILHTFIEHLRLRGYNKKYLDSDMYSIVLNGSNDFQRIRELAHVEKLGGIIGSLSQFLPTLTNSKDNSEDLGPIFSKKYFLTNMLKMTTDELVENEQYLEEEKNDLIARASAASEESSPEDEEEDMGF